MGLVAAKAKQGAEQATQKTGKDGKVVHKSNDVKDQLINFMETMYEEKVKPAESFDDFYHAIYEIIELFCQKRGQVQYKIPTREELKKAYEEVRSKSKKGQDLDKQQFMLLTEKILRVDSFTFGREAINVLMVLFGTPVCALLAKRVVPGLKSFSDDVVIPVATSGAVVYLAKMNKL